MKTILVTTDFSDCSKNAIRYSLKLSLAANCRLVVFNSVHIPRFPSITSREYNRLISRDELSNRRKIETEVKDICRKLRIKYPSPKIKIVSKEGLFTVDNIIKATQTYKADLLVMGTHGAGGIKKFLFGSNTSEAISKSSIPVIAVPKRYRYRKIRSIVYASDLKNVYLELQAIIPFAKTLNADIDILNLEYVWDDKVSVQEILNKNVIKSGLKNVKLTIRKANIDNTMIDQIKNYVRKSKPQLIIMFPEEKKWLENILIGSKTEEFAYNLTIPLMSIKKELRIKN